VRDPAMSIDVYSSNLVAVMMKGQITPSITFGALLPGR